MCTFVQLVYMARVWYTSRCGIHLVFVLYACIHVHYVCALSVGCVLCYSKYINSMRCPHVACGMGGFCVICV